MRARWHLQQHLQAAGTSSRIVTQGVFLCPQLTQAPLFCPITIFLYLFIPFKMRPHAMYGAASVLSAPFLVAFLSFIQAPLGYTGTTSALSGALQLRPPSHHAHLTLIS